jgi:hypothetical protein
MIEVFSLSEVGGHAENEDAFKVCPHPDDAECYLCAIADGQGGQPGGGPAARLASERCIQEALRYRARDLLRPSTWTTLLRTVDEAVAKDSAAGFTTLAAFCLSKSAICGASSGDSAIVLFDEASRGSILTDRQHKNPPVGSGVAAFVPFAASMVAPWIVLALSDGVWKYTGWEYILSLDPVRRVEEVVAELLAKASLPNGGLQDDFTIVALQYNARFGDGGRTGGDRC